MNESEDQQQTHFSIPDVSAGQSFDLSDQAALISTFIIYSSLCQTIAVSGVVTNVINIMCFIRHGFKDAVNISLLGLAISDFGCLITLVWINLSVTFSVSAADLPFDSLEVLYLVAGKPHITFTRVTSWITALITLERCLCIIAPLKVKNIVTPQRVCIVVCGVFIILMFCEAPLYVVNRLGRKFFPRRNKTLIGLLSTGDSQTVDKWSFIINNFFMPIAAFVIIIICTVLLVVSLQKRTKWHKKFTTAAQGDVSNRNQKLAKMVVMISALFIACFVPVSIIVLAMAFEPGLTFGGKYINIGTVVCGIGLVLESINSSANIFIYYHMSSKYRDAFYSIFFQSKKN